MQLAIQKITQLADPLLVEARQFFLQAFEADPAFASARHNPNPAFAGYVRDEFQPEAFAKNIESGTSLQVALRGETRDLVGATLTQYFEPSQIPSGWIAASGGFLQDKTVQYWDWGVVRQDLQGQGIGRELYQARDVEFQNWLAARGEVRDALQFLMVLESNPSRAIHEHAGFAPIGRGITYPELVLMARPFDPGK